MKPTFAPLAPMLCKLIPRLGSDHAGEVVATAAAIGRVLRNGGCDWHDIAGAIAVLPKPQAVSADDDWRATLAFCAMHVDCLKTHEREFLRSLAHWRGNLTEKQRNWLEGIAAKLRDSSA
jgi:hypothetical protein